MLSNSFIGHISLFLVSIGEIDAVLSILRYFHHFNVASDIKGVCFLRVFFTVGSCWRITSFLRILRATAWNVQWELEFKRCTRDLKWDLFFVKFTNQLFKQVKCFGCWEELSLFKLVNNVRTHKVLHPWLINLVNFFIITTTITLLFHGSKFSPLLLVIGSLSLLLFPIAASFIINSILSSDEVFNDLLLFCQFSLDPWVLNNLFKG